MAILRLQTCDGQDFIADVGGYGGSILLGVKDVSRGDTDPELVAFTSDDVRAIMAILAHMLTIADEEIKIMEAKDGN